MLGQNFFFIVQNVFRIFSIESRSEGKFAFSIENLFSMFLGILDM